MTGVHGGGRARAAVAGAAAAATSLAWAWHPSFWTDEEATLSTARRSFSDLWRMLGNIELVSGLYGALMHVWIDVAGTSELLLRLPSAMAVGVAGACTYLVGLRLGGARLALWGALTFALLPRVFWAGAEARPYALTVVLAAAATLALLAALDRGTRAAWIGYSVLLVLGILSNVYVGLVIGAHLVSVLADRTVTRAQRITWFRAAAVAAVIVLPFLAAASQQTGQLGAREFGPRQIVQNVGINQWFLGDTPTLTTGAGSTQVEAGDLATWWAPAAVVLAAAGWMLVLAGLRRSGSLPGVDPRGRSPVAWCLPWLVVPTTVIVAYSLVTSTYSARYTSFASPAMALLIAFGLLAVPVKARVAALAVLVLAAVPVFASQRQVYGKNSSDWVRVAEVVEEGAEPGDGVYFAPRYDVPGPIVQRTTRGIRNVYPDAFAGLVDLTLIETPESAADLTGRSRRLRASGEQLATLEVLWVIRRVDYPPERAEEDDDLLVDAGFEPTLRWDGPLDVVLRFERADPAG